MHVSPKTVAELILLDHEAGSRGGSSQYCGVSWVKSKNKWVTQIRPPGLGRSVIVGRFDCEIEAACAYDKKASELHGEFARINFPDGRKP